jgi:hypothetical protein
MSSERILISLKPHRVIHRHAADNPSRLVSSEKSLIASAGMVSPMVTAVKLGTSSSSPSSR